MTLFVNKTSAVYLLNLKMIITCRTVDALKMLSRTYYSIPYNKNRLFSGNFDLISVKIPTGYRIYVPACFKSRKSRSTKAVSDDDDEMFEEVDNDKNMVGKGTEIRTHFVSSMRADLLLKAGLGISRNKIEEAFYESKVRVNSKKLLKKSAHVTIGDELDLVKGVSPSNPNFLVVGRVEILSAKGRDEEGIDVKMRKSKSLIIENYPDGDPWKPSESPPPAESK